MTSKFLTVSSRLLFLGLTVCLLASPMQAEEKTFELDAAATPCPEPAPAPVAKYCTGKYVNSAGTEVIITLGCPNATDPCVCSATGVSCGGSTYTVGNMTLVGGSCGQVFPQATTNPSSGT